MVSLCPRRRKNEPNLGIGYSKSPSDFEPYSYDPPYNWFSCFLVFLVLLGKSFFSWARASFTLAMGQSSAAKAEKALVGESLNKAAPRAPDAGKYGDLPWGPRACEWTSSVRKGQVLRAAEWAEDVWTPYSIHIPTYSYEVESW